MLPDTFEVLRASKLLNPERRGRAAAEALARRAVEDIGDIDDSAMIADETRVLLAGDAYSGEVADELNEIFGEDSRPEGVVHHALAELPTENGAGWALCSARVTRRVPTSDGGSVVVRKVARFASCTPEIVVAFRLRGPYEQAARAVERAQSRTAEAISRNPAIAAHMPDVISGARERIDRALPAPPAQNGAGS